MSEASVRSRRFSLGAFEAWAYHDYPVTPSRSPLYVGVRVGSHSVEKYISPSSRLRPFSGDGDG